MRCLRIAALLLAGITVPAGAEKAGRDIDAGLVVDHVVILMRHGVRPPTKEPALPVEITSKAWPQWPVQPGWLTPHGAVAVGQIARWDGAQLRRKGVIAAKGCPAPDSVRIVADSDQRTIATAQAWRDAVAPGCNLPIDHRPQGQSDPRFSPLEAGLASFDPAVADAAVADAVGLGGIAALEEAHRPLLRRLDAILCDPGASGCGVQASPSGLAPARQDKRPKLTGALDRASTAAQVLLLEYADAKPMDQVGWGKVTADDIAAFSAFHATEFRVLARPRYLAAANFSGLAPLIREGLTGAAKVTVISGHDTNIANLAGLLGMHWQVPGLAQDDPTPGGAIILEALHGRDGQAFVRLSYRSQTLEQIRRADSRPIRRPYQQSSHPASCGAPRGSGLCSLKDVKKLLVADGN